MEPAPDGPTFLMAVTNDEADAIHVARRKAWDEKVAAWRLERLTARLDLYADPEREVREWSQLDPGSRLRWRERYALMNSRAERRSADDQRS